MENRDRPLLRAVCYLLIMLLVNPFFCKSEGITHFAFLCPDVMAAKERLEAAGIPLSSGPVRFGPAAQGIFVYSGNIDV